ncbi:hypothetical protein EXW55_17640 [Bacillus mycoides]|nr:hypothetical protein EXW55_17640 [Bacillus mycoides]
MRREGFEQKRYFNFKQKEQSAKANCSVHKKNPMFIHIAPWCIYSINEIFGFIQLTKKQLA